MTTQPQWSIERLILLDPRLDGRISEAGAGCWIWGGAVMKGGYGNLCRDQRNYRAHRWTYELLAGPIPDGLQLDHLCRVRLCVNPAHLEPVDNWTNTLRGSNEIARHAMKTECDHGHPFDQANTYHWRGGRYCRACRADAKRRQRERRAS